MFHRHSKISLRAFTLIEVLIAMTILSTAVVGIFAVFLLGLQTTSRALHFSQAIDLASSTLEKASVLPSDVAEGTNGTSDRFNWKVITKQKSNNLVLFTSVVRWNEAGSTFEYRLSKLRMRSAQDK